MTTRIVFALCAAALAAFAQVHMESRPLAQAPEAGVMFQMAVPPPPGGGGGDVMFLHAEMGGMGKVVKGAPYSAEVATEHKQTLADGNTIRNKQTGTIYRDSEGRTRREQPLGPIGPLAVQPGTSPVFINDPIGGVSYVLNAENKTAQKLQTPKAVAEFAEGGVPHSAKAELATPGRRIMHQMNRVQSERESLGTKTIEGVQAEGTRTVFTIAAGEIGNERPIQTVTERWYSPQLQTVVLTKTSDPRMGETTYALTNINLAEPAHALFEVPADYNVVDGPQRDVMFMNRRQPRENK